MSDSASLNPQSPVDSSRLVWLCIPAWLLALTYPVALDVFHQSYATHGMNASAVLALLLAYSAPTFALAAAWRLGCVRTPSLRVLLARRAVQAFIAVPPAYTLLGVLLALMRISERDIIVWTGLSIFSAALIALCLWTTDPRRDAETRGSLESRVSILRHTHGISAALLLAIFLAGHLFNHLCALEGSDVHAAVMKVLRVIYRNRSVEPALLLLVLFQVVSGLTLWRPRTVEVADFLATLQTASGAYLFVYLASHVNSVFVLARRVGIETDWGWASGAPTGVLADEWNIRLLPHYSLAVFFLIAHLSCGLRLVLRAHGVSSVRSDVATWFCIAAGTLLAIAISAALVGFRLGG